MTICPLWGPLFSLRPSVSSTAICPLYGLPFTLQPSVPSTALCLLCITSEPSETTLLFHEMFCKMRFIKTLRVIAIYFVLVIIAIIAIITVITQAKYSAIIAK